MNMHRHSLAIRALVAAFALGLAGPAAAACKDCGTVVDVKVVKKKGEASGAGAVIGGVAGGVLGHQIGSGRGNTAATVVGAGAGAYAGHEIEKNQKSTTSHQVVVKMEDGKTRTFNYQSATSYRVGDKVKVSGSTLTRQ
ncbi:MAG TPA: glycine zipper 2TM domain-containing protein [Usitatibacter sp.]|nr:glycine zipper 2TM domain-containing protein [Usitatibacter sp.]